MIESKIRDGSEKVVTFVDIQPDVMQKITNYMYTGSVNIPNKLVLEVVQVCDELKIEDLKERCLYRVPEILCPQTVIAWLKYARKHDLDSICESCERYISYSFSDIGKEKFFIRCSLDELKSTLQDLNGVLSPEDLLTSVFSWINFDKNTRNKALDYTLRYLELKKCRKEFVADSAKAHIDIFQNNPEFNCEVTHILHPGKLTIVVIGGMLKRGEEISFNTKGWKLMSETKFVDIAEIRDDLLIRAPGFCLCDLSKLILTGGRSADVCVMLDMSTKKGITNLKYPRRRHASVCILKQLFVFGGKTSSGDLQVWSTSVEYLNIEQDHGEWHAAPPMPAVLKYPKVTNVATNVYLMGDNNPVPHLFDVVKKVWSQKSAMPQNPGIAFSIASGNGNLYAVGGSLIICWQYNFPTDSWAKLSSPALTHYAGALIFHQNSLLLLGGDTEHIEGYATEADIWAVAPYKLPEKLLGHAAFMMDLGE